MEILIKRNPNGDTRTAPNNITFKQFQEANDMHIKEVRMVMYEIAEILQIQGRGHDWTKKTEEGLFFSDFLATKNEGKDFVNREWYQYHIHNEKHHPLSYCHDDITLLDIIEMVTDCVCAGKARSGEVRELEIDEKILKLALSNTVKLIDSMTIIER